MKYSELQVWLSHIARTGTHPERKAARILQAYANKEQISRQELLTESKGPTMNYNKSGYAFQYPDGSLAAIDRDSGGYLWKAPSILWVWITTKEELEKYPLGSSSEEEGIKIVPITIMVSTSGS